MTTFETPNVPPTTIEERNASAVVAEARQAVGRLKPAELCELPGDIAFRIEGTQRALIVSGTRSGPEPGQMRFAAGLWQLSDIMAEVSKTDAREREFRDLFKRWMRAR